MGFKKTKLKKSYFIPNLIWAISLCLVFLMWFIFTQNTIFFNFNIDNNDLINDKKWGIISINNNNNTIKDSKNDNEYIDDWKNKMNFLLIWRWWWNHEAPNLTDTIILASINLKTKIISMLSIPRDIYVVYPDSSKKWKINSIYANYKDKNIWIKKLKQKLTEMTWEEIDYYINIDFNWFKKVIDTIWWIEINIPENFVDYEYPDWNWWYQTLIFKKWTWIFDWENALKYARSRHSTSDFDRSLRQQQVIKAVRDKLTWSYFITSPLKIKELYEVFKNYVDTDLNITTILKLAIVLNWKSNFNILSSNLNDSCFYWSTTCTKWWFLYSPNRDLFWGLSVLLANWTNVNNLSNYKILNKYSNIVFNYPWIFVENYKINIFNWVKIRNLALELSNDLIKYWFNVPEVKSIWNTDKIYEKSIIYYNNIEENYTTINALKNLFNWEFIKTEKPLFSKDNAQIEIIIWEDYNTKNNPFEF